MGDGYFHYGDGLNLFMSPLPPGRINYALFSSISVSYIGFTGTTYVKTYQTDHFKCIQFTEANKTQQNCPLICQKESWGMRERDHVIVALSST